MDWTRHTLDPSTDTYIWVKAVREWSELIVQGAYTGQLATMARQLYRALPQPQ
jgi:Ni,Fe-hydrogenase III small subunit